MNNWKWREKREKKAFIALEDGSIWYGHSFGANKDQLGEVVFNTGMTGYQEILTDPSYNGQIVLMTYPEIGNYGINSSDVESRSVFANGFLIQNLNQPQSWRSELSLQEYLQKYEIPALEGIETRALTLKLRECGTMKAFISVSGKISEEQAVQKAKKWAGLDGQDYATKVTCPEIFVWDESGEQTKTWGIAEKLPKTDLNIIAYDFGIKWNILRRLRLHGMKITVVPAKTPASDILAMNPDGVFLSNGPADPAAVKYAIDNIKQLIGKLPLMGICLGHQLLGLALGAKTKRLKFGHHGCNHPVKDLKTGKVEITSQNHNYMLDENSMNENIIITHINLNDNTVEGIRHATAPAFSVQYHPEAAPGPHDPEYLFQRFRKMILDTKES